MDFLSFGLFLIIIGMLYYYFEKKSRYFLDRNIPYASGWPLFGNLSALIFRRKHISDVIRQIYNSHQDAKYVGAFEFTKPIIVLKDPELIKSIAIKNFDKFPGRQAFVDESIDPLFACNMFNIIGDYWQEMKNLLSPTFTSNRMRIMYTTMTRNAENYVNSLLDMSRDKRRMFSTKDFFTRYTCDTIAECLYGINVDTLKEPENDFYLLGKEGTNFDGAFTIKLWIARFYPRILLWLGLKFIPERVIDFFKSFIDQTVKRRDEMGISYPDMIQLMIDGRSKPNKHLKLDLIEMTSQAFTFFFGGFDTTSTQICITAHELAVNPKVQKRLQEEIDEVMQRTDENPNYEDIQGMLYLDAVFNETMRRHPQASILERVCVKDFELPAALSGGKTFILTAGMKIWIPVVGIHMDSRIYENPEIFDPRRFYGKKVTINDAVNLGFGIGPRACIGSRFSVLEAKVLLVRLLRRFDLKSNEKTLIPLSYDKTTYTINAEGGFWLSVELRNECLS